MAWSSPPTFTSGNVLTAAQLTILRDDLLETGPAKATGGGGIIMVTGLNTLVQRSPLSSEYLPENSTSNTSYSFFTGGPAASMTTGPAVYCWITAFMANDTAGAGARMSIDSIGSHSPSDNTCLAVTTAANYAYRGTALLRISGLTPGVNTFTACYRAASGTASFTARRVDILQLG